MAQSSAEGYAAAVAINLPANVQKILSRDFHLSLQQYRPQNVIAQTMSDANTDDPLSRMQYTDLMTWLPGRMLVKTDRASMAHGLEVRPPLLDHRLVEWAGQLPASFKLQNGARKRVLKQAFEPRLGHAYLNRPKKGFDAPIVTWLRSDTRNPLDRLANSSHWRDCGFLNAAVIDRMSLAHRSGRANYAQELWSVIMFDAFLANVAAV